jgi:hypothetical protein
MNLNKMPDEIVLDTKTCDNILSQRLKRWECVMSRNIKLSLGNTLAQRRKQ